MSNADDDRDPLFRYDEPIFAKGELLEIEHLPGSDRIVGRDEQLQSVAKALNPAIFGRKPKHLAIYGKTGTGKSLTARSVTERVIDEASNEGITVKKAFVDCGQNDTETMVVKSVASQLNNPNVTDTHIPERGLATGDYYNRLWKAIDTCSDVTIVILDEVDMLRDDEVLRKLSRAGENRLITNAKIGIIAISNKINFPDQLSERVKSSFTHTELVFPPYDANELISILENRRDAFREDVLTDDVIPLTAALAAQEHGDARKALDILRTAGNLATDQGATQVTKEHVEEARDKAERDRFRELISGVPTQSAAVLLALTLLTQSSREDEFTTKTIYDTYCDVAEEIDLNLVGERRIHNLLQELDFLEVINSEKEGRGRGQGVALKHRLLERPKIVEEVLRQNTRLAVFFDD